MAIHFNAGEGLCIRRIAGAVNKVGRPFLYATPGKMFWIRPKVQNNKYPHISSDNPIHNILSIESEVAGEEKTAKAYTVISDIIKIAKEKIADETSPSEKLQKLYGIIRKDFDIPYGEPNLLSEGLAKRKKIVDCDAGSFVFIAVAHELRWPVYLATSMGHAFIFWQNSENKYLGFETINGGDIRGKDRDLLKQEAGLIVRNGRKHLFAQAYYNRGVTYNDLGKHDLAIRDYTKAIELRPDYPEAYNNRGNTYGELSGKHDLAIRDYTKAIELRPDFAEAYYNRGVTYNDLGKHALAVRDCNRVIDLRPNYPKAYFSRGNAYYYLGKHDLAIKNYTKAIKFKHDFAEAYNNRGNAFNKLGKHYMAIKDHAKAIEFNPDLLWELFRFA